MTATATVSPIDDISALASLDSSRPDNLVQGYGEAFTTGPQQVSRVERAGRHVGQQLQQLGQSLAWPGLGGVVDLCFHKPLSG
jgi:hypothetical protein